MLASKTASCSAGVICSSSAAVQILRAMTPSYRSRVTPADGVSHCLAADDGVEVDQAAQPLVLPVPERLRPRCRASLCAACDCVVLAVALGVACDGCFRLTRCLKSECDHSDDTGVGIVNFHQRNQIRATQKMHAASQAAELHRADSQADQSAALEARFDRLRLATESMWMLVKETTGLTEEHLIRKIEQLDMQDGSMDGKRSERASECGCGAMVNARSMICVHCGADAPMRSVFDRI